MIPRLKPALGLSEIVAALNFFSTNDIFKFEKQFAAIADQKYALAFPYGRTALVAILKALELNQAEILCPAYTCVVVPHAIVTSENTPVFIDSSPNDFNMDLTSIGNAVSSDTRALIATSIFGYPVDLEQLDRFRKTYPNVHVIQDCAHSFMCSWNRRLVNKQGLCAFYGLNISKIMTSIFGGMVTTDDYDYYCKLKEERNKLLKPSRMTKSVKRLVYLLSVYPAFNKTIYGLINNLEKKGYLDRFVKYYDPEIIDMPADYQETMTPVEARVGASQCDRYENIVNHRKRLVKIYNDQLKGLNNLQLPVWNDGATWSHYVIKTPIARQIINECLAKGVQLGELIEYHIPSMPSYNKYKSIDNNISSRWPGNVINLPVHTGCSDKDAYMISNLIKSSKEKYS